MTDSKHARALRRKNKALKDTTRGATFSRCRREREEENKVRTDSHKNDTADAIIDFDETL